MPPDDPRLHQPIGWYEGQPVSHPSEKPVDVEDPFDPSAMRVPFEEPQEGLLAAARCYIEEYITMGYTDLMLLQMFGKPFYMGLNPIYKSRGKEFVLGLIRECRQDLETRGAYPRQSSKAKIKAREA